MGERRGRHATRCSTPSSSLFITPATAATTTACLRTILSHVTLLVTVPTFYVILRSDCRWGTAVPIASAPLPSSLAASAARRGARDAPGLVRIRERFRTLLEPF